MLLLVALVPLIGVGSVTWTRVQQARAQRDRASATEAEARQVVHLARLDAALVAETNWRATRAVLAAIEFPPELVAKSLGVDIGHEADVAQTRVDELLAGWSGRIVDGGRVRRQVDAARATSRDFPAALAEYDGIEADVRRPLLSALTSLIEAGQDGDPDGLAATARRLRSAVELRTSVSRQMDAYFSVLFDVRDGPLAELTRLVRLQGELEAVLGELSAETPDSGAEHLALNRVEASEDLAFLRSSVDGLVGRSLVAGLPAHAPPLTPAAGMNELGTFGPVFTATRAVSALSVDVIVATGNSVLDAAVAAASSAEAAIRRAYLVAASVTVPHSAGPAPPSSRTTIRSWPVT